MRFSPLILAVLLAGCAGATHPNAVPPQAAQLHVETFGKDAPEAVRTLVVIIHDDGEPGSRSDEADFARAAVRALPDTLAATMLRPGHRNARGDASPGARGAGTGDNYTLDRLTALGQQIALLKRRYPGARLILVGDGGGAALVADLAGLNPVSADAMLLVGCPCALPEWRKHMAKRTGNAGWTAAVQSLDPLKFAGGISTTLRVAVLVGADDAVTPVALSRAYVEALTLRGIGTDYRIVPARGHDLLGDPETLSALTRLVSTLPEKP